MSFGAPLSPTAIGAMAQALSHRGPDDEGYVALQGQGDALRVTPLRGPVSTIQDLPFLTEFAGGARLYLGHRRLAILDLSPAGHQPMAYGDHLWIVFNGEIYNYVELREELKAAGYEFSTGTDTEVILAAYDRWGEGCVTRFNGDWAFAILDTQRRVLFLSRDRYGIKPLYFVRGDDSFAFASEIKALFSLPSVPRSLNPEKALQYLALFCRDHTEETLFDGIYQLRPGESLRIDLQTGQLWRWLYYTPTCSPELGAYDHRKALAYAADIRDLLFDAVRLRLRADVPVGTCLSGGLDSSVVVAIMAELLRRDGHTAGPRTFTAVYPGEAIDESAFARLAAQQAGASSHFVYPSREGYWQTLPTLLYYQDEPFGGPSAYAQWEVMREVSRHVKVVLDGQGGDEV
ncbi:MAG: asparagine synthase (glutamine-hydrolyzing), partial [Candidatus Entotheonellia bacterium]